MYLNQARLQDPDVQRWKRRLERCLKDIPKGVHLYGMDDNLLLVTAACKNDMVYINHTHCSVPFLGCYGEQDPVPWLEIEQKKAYIDSGGF